MVYSAAFDPYGGMQKQWVNTYQPSLKFSGKERESKSEMDYFGARYYDHQRYRFISVDPVINKDEALVNPQLWNLYAYCRNNPITYLDPDGRTELKFYIKLGILEIDPQQHGRESYRIPASSGEKEGLNNPNMINVKDKGPIPVGEYEINSKDLSDPGLIKDIIRNVLGDWGDWRVPIKPKSGTQTFGRDGFLLHGGKKKGSRGCIDIGGGRFGDKTTDQVKKDIMRDPDKKVPLTVVK